MVWTQDNRQPHLSIQVIGSVNHYSLAFRLSDEPSVADKAAVLLMLERLALIDGYLTGMSVENLSSRTNIKGTRQLTGIEYPIRLSTAADLVSLQTAIMELQKTSQKITDEHSSARTTILRVIIPTYGWTDRLLTAHLRHIKKTDSTRLVRSAANG